MLSFLTTPGVSPLSRPLLHQWFGTPKLVDFQQKLVWHGSGAGKDVQLLRAHQAFQPWASVTEMPSAGCVVLATIAFYPCVKCWTRKGVGEWSDKCICEKSRLFVFCPYARTCCLHLQYSLCILGRNKVKGLLSIASAPLSFRKAVNS